MMKILTSVLFLAIALPSTACAQMIVAHRGASHEAPENTMASFQLAWQQQADAIEGDFYLTADQQIVCFHDNTTKRTAPGQQLLTITESTWEQLKTLDVGQWKSEQYRGETIPTLQQVLESVPEGKQIFVELKSGPEIVPFLVPVVRQSGLSANQITFISFHAEVIRQVRQQLAEYKANWLTGYDQHPETLQWSPSADRILSVLKHTGATGLGCEANRHVVNKALLDQLQHKGYELHVWTVNQPDDARYFAELGIKSITTDKPGLIRMSINTDQQ